MIHLIQLLGYDDAIIMRVNFFNKIIYWIANYNTVLTHHNCCIDHFNINNFTSYINHQNFIYFSF